MLDQLGCKLANRSPQMTKMHGSTCLHILCGEALPVNFFAFWSLRMLLTAKFTRQLMFEHLEHDLANAPISYPISQDLVAESQHQHVS